MQRGEPAARTAQPAEAFAAHVKVGDWEDGRRIACRAVGEHLRRMREFGQAANHEDGGQ